MDDLDKIIKRLGTGNSPRRKTYPSQRQIKKRRRDRGDPENIGFPNERLGLRAFGDY